MKWGNSTTFRIWISMNFLVLLGIVSLSSIYFLNESNRIEHSLRSEGRTAANTLSSAIAISMLDQEYSSISPLSYSLLDQPNIQYVVVRDKEGVVVNQKGDTLTNDDLLIEKVPLLYFNSRLGEVEIALKTETLNSQLNSLLTSTLILAIIVSICAMVISTVVSKKLSLPLENLMNAAKQMIEGKRRIQVKEEGTNEILSLSSAFNQMASTIEQNEENLKQEIQKATQSLSEKIKTLNTLSNISQSVLGKDLNHQDVICIILKEIRTFIKPNKLSIAMLGKDRNSFDFHILNQENQLKFINIPYNDTPIHLVYQNKQFIIKTDLSESNHLFPSEINLFKEGIRSTVIIPLIIEERVLGTLNLGNFQANYYNAEIVKQLSVFTNQIALALDRVSAYESLQESAYHDFLTELPNYRAFKDAICKSLDEVKTSKDYTLAVMFLDIDRFKKINDTLGHEFGDHLLKRVAKLIRNCLDEEHIVARVGGDEFVILLPNIKTGNEAITIASNIRNEINQPITINDYEVHVTASIGIALYPSDGEDEDTLMKHADAAMYRAKETGKNSYCFYSPIESDPSYEQLIFENELRKALEREEFTVYYQPKINIQTGEVSGLEALVRWKHPKKGLISPGKFIPIAEETGLIIPIGQYVLKTACEQAVRWRTQGFPPLVVSVNLSTKQFLQSNLVESIKAILDETGLPPHLLELEITESMTMDVEQAIKILNHLKQIGVQISVDDFGTGYSSLNYLKKLPIDRLKIDRSFITDISTNNENAAIVSTIINMAYNLNLHVICEGVEEESQVIFLQKNNCDEIQGYYFSHPLSTAELESKFKDIQSSALHWSKIVQ